MLACALNSCLASAYIRKKYQFPPRQTLGPYTGSVAPWKLCRVVAYPTLFGGGWDGSLEAIHENKTAIEQDLVCLVVGYNHQHGGYGSQDLVNNELQKVMETIR